MSQEQVSWLRQNVLMGFTDPKYGRGTAWHHSWDDEDSVENHYPDAIPVDDVVKKLFGWNAIEIPLADGTFGEFGSVVDDSRKLIVHPNTRRVLGVHHDGYEVHQFQDWLLDKVAMIVDDDLKIGSAGKLRGDALAWVSVELPESIQTKEGVTYRPRLLCVTAHDGTVSSRYSGCTIIVQCDNTLTIGMSEASGNVFRVRHTKHSEAKIADAHEALGFVHTMSDDFAKEIAALCGTKVSDQQFEKFINTIVPMPDEDGAGKTRAQTKHAILSRLWRTDDRVSPWKNTAWGALMATNTANHHEYGVRNSTRAERNFTKIAFNQFTKDDRSALGALQAVLT